MVLLVRGEPVDVNCHPPSQGSVVSEMRQANAGGASRTLAWAGRDQMLRKVVCRVSKQRVVRLET